MGGLKNWLAGSFTNPATGQASHTKIWANVAYAAMTYKFVMVPEQLEWMWWAYGCVVGGYALIKRGLSLFPQLEQMKQQGDGNVAATPDE